MTVARGGGTISEAAAVARLWVTPARAGGSEPEPRLASLHRGLCNIYQATRTTMVPLSYDLAELRGNGACTIRGRLTRRRTSCSAATKRRQES